MKESCTNLCTFFVKPILKILYTVQWYAITVVTVIVWAGELKGMGTNISAQDSIFSEIFNSGCYQVMKTSSNLWEKWMFYYGGLIWGLFMACDVHTALFCSLMKGVTSLYGIAV